MNGKSHFLQGYVRKGEIGLLLEALTIYNQTTKYKVVRIGKINDCSPSEFHVLLGAGKGSAQVTISMR